MRHKLFWLVTFAFVLVGPVWGQKLDSPKLTSQPSTAAQDAILREGIQLHDGRQFDEAIKKYEIVLRQNPNNPIALYEKAFSYYAKGDLAKALENAYQAAKYQSDSLPRIYDLIGNVLDDQKDGKKAIEVYLFGVKQFPQDYLLHFNLGVAYARQNNQREARTLLKQAASLNPNHPGSQLVLASVFLENNYRVPALLAASRFFMLEPNTERTRKGLQILFKVLQGGAEKGAKPNEIKIFANLDSPADEGDFAAAELVLGIGKAAGMSGVDQGKTEAQLLSRQINAFIAALAESKKRDRTKFVWQYYVPYFEEMKKLQLVEPFANLLRLQVGDEKSRQWLAENDDKLAQLLQWSKNYQFPAEQK